jgi:hypothetical protein
MEYTEAQMEAMIQERIAAMTNSKKTTSPAAQVMNNKPARASKVNASEVLSAPRTSSFADSLVHPKDTPLENGVGRFDGEYEITIQRCEVKNADSGQLFSVTFKIDSSNNDRVHEGSTREHAIFWWSKPGKGETRVLWEKFAEAIGKELDTAVAEEIYGEAQAMAGTRWELSVSTKPQKGDSRKSFTHHRYTSLD